MKVLKQKNLKKKLKKILNLKSRSSFNEIFILNMKKKK